MASSMLITSAGLREVVNAEHDGTTPIKLTHIAFGTGKYVPSAERTSLEAEFKRFDAISGGAVGDNVLHVSARDASSESYIVHEIGLFTESGTLFAVCSDELPLIQKSARSQALLSIDMAVVGFSAESIVLGDTNFLNPPATTTTAGVVYLASDSDIEEGTSISKVVTAKALKNAIGNAKSGAVLYESEQALGDPQKAQARKNIDAVSSKELSDGLAGKQNAGDYPTRTEMNQAINANDAIPRNGSRGKLAGHEAMNAALTGAQTINKQSLDDMIINAAVRLTVQDGGLYETWQKNIVIMNAGVTVAPGSKWKWVGGSAPKITARSLLVCKWAAVVGFLNLVATE